MIPWPSFMKIVLPPFSIRLSLTCMAVVLFCCERGKKNAGLEYADGDWVVPPEVVHLQQPEVDSVSLAEGKALYEVYCWACHGETGMGDGAAGGAMGSQPANFHAEAVQAQASGALFWKIGEGRGAMPGFAGVLTDEQRWNLVAYIRHLGTGEAVIERSAQPQALEDGISILHWTKVPARAIRILHEPKKQMLWYVTFEGDVFRFPIDRPYEVEKVLGAEHHGISRLQGAALHGETLYLTGNIRVNDNKGTTGWMMRVQWDEDGNPLVSNVFSTVEYGTTNTPFDHGWSATAISPDEQYIYVVSGSRTDHGEIQDNLGAYPGSRDEPLTARIFRIPIDAENLLLPNDIDELKALGYVYAEGLRNAFDIEFDAEGNLFAVVNSGDYDQNEDMFWVREGFHYGYPWVMGGMDTPQQFPDWYPDPDNDPFLNAAAVARLDDFYNDPGFAKRPEGLVFGKGMDNYGPDANKFRDITTGKVMDASDLNIPITTFTPHSSPLGLVIDKEGKLPGKYNGTAFTLRYTKGSKSALMKPFTDLGEDLLHLEMTFNKEKDNYDLRTTRVAEGFTQPVDAVLVDKDIYVIEYGGRQRGGNIWKVSIE